MKRRGAHEAVKGTCKERWQLSVESRKHLSPMLPQLAEAS